jgi:hypothetical protein
MDTIPFIVSATGEDAATKGLFTRSSGVPRLVDIPLEQLKMNLSTVSSTMVEALQGIKEVGRFRLKEVTLQVEITAQGGIYFIGTASMEGKGAITLKFEEPLAGGGG